ncbi:MAG: S-adenosylmethionine:tRNA ribosyltransferase-isomerase [Clostridiales bacterium]|jgi:S-adenosylmethionine:tRNA ribosyltransferase-isomerase|nr:S-adenosylmethionine:tRNA ribosyltransferase-isomerase [Clostridiales bacterium]MDN5282385.1 S-adenosylmethionine:tRNA ribosyltransferase-isomerase [Candidatus Ozemobacter sp.]
MKTDLFDFELPEELIAQTPAPERSGSRLLVYDRSADRLEHRNFQDIVEYFNSGDLLILNSSKVIPARMYTVESSYGRAGYEILFVKEVGGGRFEAMVKPGRRFKPGKQHMMPGNNLVEVDEVLDSGLRVLHFVDNDDPVSIYRRHGEMPLPPYITSRESSPDRYQTVYSNEEGSIAAPTAGLHFDEHILAALARKGVKIATVVLHVGLGTFKPVECDNIFDHKMHEEVFNISEETAELFSATRAGGNRVWACGTTSVRTLESAIQSDGSLKTGWQKTEIFISPGYKFKAIDCLITNFHLPRSTLLMLVSAFATREKILELYNEAVKERYRFFSFGDSMVLL